MTNVDLTYLTESFRSYGISLTDIQKDQFVLFYDLLVEKNKVMNLTGITEWKDVVRKHFIDSIMLSGFVPDMTEMSLSVIDVGTGAGFPGIPLKIVFPNLKLTLLDSLKKRIGFLDEVISALSLKDVRTVHGRAEDFGRDHVYREQYDLVVSRAVAKMTLLSELCLPFVKVGGVFAAYKTEDGMEECRDAYPAIRILGGDDQKISMEKYTLDGYDVDRVYFMIPKIKSTPEKYPRRSGVIEKRPII
jgi:16S rRNA (guanine527-N7)-methyltransferase